MTFQRFIDFKTEAHPPFITSCSFSVQRPEREKVPNGAPATELKKVFNENTGGFDLKPAKTERVEVPETKRGLFGGSGKPTSEVVNDTVAKPSNNSTQGNTRINERQSTQELVQNQKSNQANSKTNNPIHINSSSSLSPHIVPNDTSGFKFFSAVNPDGGLGSTASTPTFGGRVTGGFSTTPPVSVGSVGRSALKKVPVVGWGLAAMEVASHASEGNWKEAGWSALSAVDPTFGIASGFARNTIENHSSSSFHSDNNVTPPSSPPLNNGFKNNQEILDLLTRVQGPVPYPTNSGSAMQNAMIQKMSSTMNGIEDQIASVNERIGGD